MIDALWIFPLIVTTLSMSRRKEVPLASGYCMGKCHQDSISKP